MLGEGRGLVLIVHALSGDRGVRSQGQRPPELHSQGKGRRTQGWLHCAQPRGGSLGPVRDAPPGRALVKQDSLEASRASLPLVSLLGFHSCP